MNIFIAILVLLIGHTFRMLRTMCILNPYVHKPAMSYWTSLGLSYMAEFLIPFRISDFIRTLSFAKLSSSPWQLSIASAVFERSIDFLCLAIIFYFISLNFMPMLVISIILIIGISLLSWLISKKVYIKVVSLFNDKIKNFLLGIYWALFRITKDLSPYSIFILVCLSVSIWGSYIVSIYFLTQTISQLPTIVGLQFYAFANINIWNITTHFSSLESMIYAVYILTPTLLIIGLGCYFKNSNHQKQHNIIPFLSEQDSLTFFELFFTTHYLKESETYYQLTHSSNIIKDLSAASEAKTFLIDHNCQLLIRKIALNNAAKKLEEQYIWLIQNPKINTPKLYSHIKQDELFVYDMEYFANGERFFTMIHFMPVSEAFGILKNILNSISHSYKELPLDITQYTQQYFESKVVENREIVLSQLHQLSEFENLTVNNISVPNILHSNIINSMHEYNNTLNFPIYQIHGDLTIENILVNTHKEYMIIDPAPSYINIYAEYAKLFQSLHAKYEHVKKVDIMNIHQNNIEYAQYATIQYEELFKKLQDYITKHHGVKGLKATYFYEAICHMRTASYMVKLQRTQKAVLMISLAGNALKKWQEI